MAKTGVSNDGEFCRMEGNVEGRPSCLRLRDFGCGQGWQRSPEQGNWLCHILLYPAPLESLRASLRGRTAGIHFPTVLERTPGFQERADRGLAGPK